MHSNEVSVAHLVLRVGLRGTVTLNTAHFGREKLRISRTDVLIGGMLPWDAEKPRKTGRTARSWEPAQRPPTDQQRKNAHPPGPRVYKCGLPAGVRPADRAGPRRTPDRPTPPSPGLLPSAPRNRPRPPTPCPAGRDRPALLRFEHRGPGAEQPIRTRRLRARLATARQAPPPAPIGPFNSRRAPMGGGGGAA